MNTAIKGIYLVTSLSLSSMVAYADNASPTTTGTTTAPAANTSSATPNASAPDVVGNYRCQRTDSANSMFSYNLGVTKTGDTYTFEWDDNTGNPVIYGTGVIHPNMTNVVAASFWDPAKPEKVGVEMFEIKPDGSLQANWVLQSENQLGTETCTK